MKLVFQIAGGLLLTGLVLMVVGFACVALLAVGASHVLNDVEKTIDAQHCVQLKTVAPQRVEADKTKVASASKVFAQDFVVEATRDAGDLATARAC